MRFLFQTLLVILLGLGVTACAGFRPVHLDPHRSELFPRGSYEAQIYYDIPESVTVSFRGMLRRDETEIKIVGYSPFGTTLFRGIENLKTHRIKWEFAEEDVAKHRRAFQRFYEIFRKIIFYPVNGESETQMSAGKNDRHPWSVKMLNFDQNRIPRKVELFEKSRALSIRVEVLRYESL